jgi:hypothetical protein
MRNSKEKEISKSVDEIQKMMDVVNLVPFNAEIPTDIQELETKFPKLAEYLSSADSIFLSAERRFLTIKLIKFEELRKLLVVMVEISEKYRTYLSALAAMNEQPKTNQLQHLIDILREFQLNSQVLPNYFDEELGSRFFEIVTKFLSVTIDESHHLQIKPNGLLRGIEKGDLRRFKQCVICKKFIWATRLNRKYCSLRCTNISTQRAFQANSDKREKYNEKRRDNYNYKKGKK